MIDAMGIFRTTIGVENPLRAGEIHELTVTADIGTTVRVAVA